MFLCSISPFNPNNSNSRISNNLKSSLIPNNHGQMDIVLVALNIVMLVPPPAIDSALGGYTKGELCA